MQRENQNNENWQEIGRLPIWDFEKNNVFIGILEKAENDVGPNKSTLYTFRTVNGELFKIWGSTILDQKLEAINIGDEVKIVYEGKQKNPQTGRTVKMFRVYRRAEPQIQTEEDEIPLIEE